MLEQRYLNLISGRSRGPLASMARGLLAAAELPYRTLMTLRNARYDARLARAHDLGRPAISIGNLTAGGTGKTPVVQWLASSLQSAGQRPAILMRGYRKTGSTLSDEQVMLQELLPGLSVEANPDRVAGARAVLERDQDTTCFILDDGFQHRRARRCFDLVLIHAGQPFGFGHVHPRGLLREPISALSRASAILITHASEVPADQLLQTQQTLRRHTAAPLFHCDHVNTRLAAAHGTQTLELSDLATLPFFLFTGIGQPQPLVASLQRFPAAFKGHQVFPDHHPYTPADLAELVTAARQANARALITTEKDFTKLAAFLPAAPDLPPLYRLQLQIRFWENEEAPLLDLIQTRIQQNPPQPTH